MGAGLTRWFNCGVDGYPQRPYELQGGGRSLGNFNVVYLPCREKSIRLESDEARVALYDDLFGACPTGSLGGLTSVDAQIRSKLRNCAEAQGPVRKAAVDSGRVRELDLSGGPYNDGVDYR